MRELRLLFSSISQSFEATHYTILGWASVRDVSVGQPIDEKGARGGVQSEAYIIS